MITLITDFDDLYVGQMKGQIYKINPDSKVIDIMHTITRQSIYEAVYVISNSYSYFPKGTVHLVVVDPGVGSKRFPIALNYDGHVFIGPDNGVFSLLKGDFFRINLDKLTPKLSRYGITNLSNTFHGRDIFAPAAALIDIGIKDFLEKINQITILPFVKEISRNKAILSVLYIDSFGNIIINLKKEDAELKEVEIFGINLPILNHYEEGKSLDLFALYSSSGHLEISKYLGNANSIFNLKSGDVIHIILKN